MPAKESPFDFSDLDFKPRPRPTQKPVPPAIGAAKPPPTPQPAARRNAPPRGPKRERAPMDVLHNPRLTLDRPTDDGFDPYNTGAFNRSASWEKIGRQKKR
jgi:hypothetical protein